MVENKVPAIEGLLSSKKYMKNKKMNTIISSVHIIYCFLLLFFLSIIFLSFINILVNTKNKFPVIPYYLYLCPKRDSNMASHLSTHLTTLQYYSIGKDLFYIFPVLRHPLAQLS